MSQPVTWSIFQPLTLVIGQTIWNWYNLTQWTIWPFATWSIRHDLNWSCPEAKTCIRVTSETENLDGGSIDRKSSDLVESEEWSGRGWGMIGLRSPPFLSLSKPHLDHPQSLIRTFFTFHLSNACLTHSMDFDIDVGLKIWNVFRCHGPPGPLVMSN